MTVQRRHHALFTEREYWSMEEFSLVHHEYFEGEVLALPDKSPTHIDIVGNIAAALHSQLDDRPCSARMSDQRIKVEATTLQTYPDVVVVCPPFRFDPDNQITLLDATVIVEVLSTPPASTIKPKNSAIISNSPRFATICSLKPMASASNIATVSKTATGRLTPSRRSTMKSNSTPSSAPCASPRRTEVWT